MTAKEALQQKLAQVAGDMAALTAAVQAENRAMIAEESQKFSKLDEEFKALETSIANFERAEQVSATLAMPAPRVAETEPTASSTGVPVAGTASFSGGTKVAHGFANHGFSKGFGEYLVKVRESKLTGRVDPRLMVNAVSTFGGESVGSDGAWALPPEFQRGIMSLITPQDSFLNALGSVQTSSNLLVVPADEDPPWGTSGVTAAKTAECAAITASKPVFKKAQVVIHDVKSLVHVSNQALNDIPFLASFVMQKMGEKLRWKCENYVINGTGQDEPTGILNAPGLLALADDTYSSATSIAPETFGSMLAAKLPGAGAFWLHNPTVGPQIWFAKTGSAGYPLYTPDISKSPGGMLLGLPVYASEACKALNTAGDVLLVVPNGYILAFNGGVNTASTIAFAFDQDLSSFRAVLRMGGEPTLSAVVTRADGVNTASNLIALAARS